MPISVRISCAIALILLAFCLPAPAPSQTHAALDQPVPEATRDVVNMFANDLQAALTRGELALARDIATSMEATAEGAAEPGHDFIARTLNDIALAYFQYRRYDEAEVYERKAYLMALNLHGQGNHDTLAYMSNLGAILMQLGRFDEAGNLKMAVYDGYMALYGPDAIDTLYALLGMALNEALRENYVVAENMTRRAYEGLRRVAGLLDQRTLEAMHLLAETLRRQERYEEAEALFRPLVEAMIEYHGEANEHTLGAIGNFASLLGDLGRYEEALIWNERALTQFEATFGEANALTLVTLGKRSNLVRALGRVEEALELEREALDRARRAYGDDHFITMDRIAGLAAKLYVMDRDAEAARYQREVLDFRTEQFGTDHPWTQSAARALAKSLFATDAYVEALPLFRADLEHRRKRLVQSLQSKPSVQRDARESLSDSATWLMRAAFAVSQMPPGQIGDEMNEALKDEIFRAAQFRDGGAGWALLQSMTRMAAADPALSAAVRGWTFALAEIESLDLAIASAATSGATEDDATRVGLLDQRAKLAETIAQSEDRLRADFPEFVGLLAPEPVSILDLQGNGESGAAPLLGESEVLIVLVPPTGSMPGLIWAVTRDGDWWGSHGEDHALISDRIALLHSMLSGEGRNLVSENADTDPALKVFNRNYAHYLYNSLFVGAGLNEILADKPDWIIVPQGMYLSLPFAALVMEEPTDDDTDPEALRQTAWLGLRKSLAVLPSIGSLRFLRGGGSSSERVEAETASTDFFGIGNPVFTGAPDADRALPSTDSLTRGEGIDVKAVAALPALPHTRREVLRMADFFGAGPDRMLMGAEANETRLAELSDSGALRQARYLLFATHGIVAGGVSGLSEPALALSPPKDFPRQVRSEAGLDWFDDGLLTASEAALLDLDADWVILSACDTASGNAPDAEGLSGLAQSFFQAGARSLLVSHWPVRDSVAARMTTDAVQRLRRDPSLTRAQALQATMFAMVHDGYSAETAHPAYWAPFQIVGVDRSASKPAVFTPVNYATIPYDVRAPSDFEKWLMDRLWDAYVAEFNAEKYEAALDKITKLLEAESQSWGPDHPWTISTREQIANVLLALERGADYTRTLRKIADQRADRIGWTDPDTIIAAKNYGTQEIFDGHPAAAESYLRLALRHAERVFGSEHTETFTLLNNLSVALRDQLHFEEAKPLAVAAYQGARDTLGPDDPATLHFEKRLGELLEMMGETAGLGAD